MEQPIELKRDKVYFPNLDGLRFFAFFAVLLRHSGTTDFAYIKSNTVYIIVKKYFFMNGLLGVNFFFVLSGFLITVDANVTLICMVQDILNHNLFNFM